VLLEFPGAKQAWREVQLWDKIDSTLRKNDNMDALIFTLLDQLPLVQRELFVMIMWSLWKCRNLKLWQQQNEIIMQVVEHKTTSRGLANSPKYKSATRRCSFDSSRLFRQWQCGGVVEAGLW